MDEVGRQVIEDRQLVRRYRKEIKAKKRHKKHYELLQLTSTKPTNNQTTTTMICQGRRTGDKEEMIKEMHHVLSTRSKAKEGQDEEKMIWLPLPIVRLAFSSCFTVRRSSAEDLQLIWILVLQYTICNPMYQFTSAFQLQSQLRNHCSPIAR